MNDAEFEIFSTLEDSHWWFVGKRLILRTLLEGIEPAGRILDLGCGTGGVLRDWSDRARCLGADSSAYALRICRDRGLDSLVQTSLVRVPFRAHSFDVVLALDVIEHLDDDVGLLRQMGDLCREGGRAIIAVPAYAFLWSQHDDTFSHKRRYTARTLESAVRRAGLVPERITYTNFFTFPFAAVWRPLSRRIGRGIAPRHDFFSLPRPLNALLVALYRLESALLRRFDLPVGVSVVCIARPDATR